METAAPRAKRKTKAETRFEPATFSDIDILKYIRLETNTEEHLKTIKSISGSNDKTISGWLNINEKTLRTYKQTNSPIKDNIKEHILYLVRLMTLGNSVFGSKEEFDRWLNTPNFFFNNESPTTFINTITGIRFAIDRLTAMEFGDNV